MPDKWIKIKEEPAQFIEILEVGVHPTRNRNKTGTFRITSNTTGDFVKLNYADLKEMIGIYRKANPPIGPVSAMMDIETMNIAICKMIGKNEITCRIMER